MPALRQLIFVLAALLCQGYHTLGAPPVEVEAVVRPGQPLNFLRGNDSLSYTLPFTKVGNLMIVKARVDSVEGNFILDTGAPYLVLNLTYFRHYPQTVEHDAEHTSITGTAGGGVAKTVVPFSSLACLNTNGCRLM